MAAHRRRVRIDPVCKLGTLAHNRQFSYRDFHEYTGAGIGTLDALKRRGIVKRVAGGYYPTAKGWNVIERACRMRG